jgi:VWFA-related protein
MMKTIALCVLLALALSASIPATSSAQQSLPDAPQPQNNAPATPPAGTANAPGGTEQQQPPQPNAQEPTAFPEAPAAAPLPPPASPAETREAGPVNPGPAPSSAVGDAPASAAQPAPDSRNRLFTLTANVNFVVVPVTVKDSSGHLVNGLVSPDFSVFENGEKQRITFFTSDPFPLSAAVVLDTAMSDKEYSKVRDTLAALTGAFSQFDEVAVWTYSNTVQKASDFSNVDGLSATLHRLKLDTRGRGNGAPVVGGPFGSGGPWVNGKPVDPTMSSVQTAVQESVVLNDAILAAAQELSKRERTRRKVIFVISDGREVGSSASYADVMKVLLSQQIGVYAVGIEPIPGYNKANKLRVPGLGYGNILPKYASATGGDVFTEISPNAIETAYARLTEQARNQYTLGYSTRITPSSSYRSVEVRVHKPDLKVYAKDGYYPLPPPSTKNEPR